MKKIPGAEKFKRKIEKQEMSLEFLQTSQLKKTPRDAHKTRRWLQKNLMWKKARTFKERILQLKGGRIRVQKDPEAAHGYKAHGGNKRGNNAIFGTKEGSNNPSEDETRITVRDKTGVTSAKKWRVKTRDRTKKKKADRRGR